eukprot:tig00021036_g17320.t1
MHVARPPTRWGWRWPRVRVGLVRLVLPLLLILLVSSVVIISVVSTTYADRTASKLSFYYLETTTERVASRTAARVLRALGDRPITSADFPAVARVFVSVVSEGGGDNLNLLGLALPNRETVVLRREPPSFLVSNPRALLPFTLVESRINGSFPELAPGTPVVCPLDLPLAAARRAPHAPAVDVRARPFFASAAKTRRQASSLHLQPSS